eukprot:7139013-Karenia_brevis.AAC.1
MQGTPWQPNPRKKTNRIPTKIDEEEDDEDDEDDANPEEIEDFAIQVEQNEDDIDIEKPDLNESTTASRAMSIRKEDVKQYGPTKGCYGCRAINEGWANIQAHSHKCRQRISEAMMEDIIGRKRVEEAEERRRRAQDESKARQSTRE